MGLTAVGKEMALEQLRERQAMEIMREGDEQTIAGPFPREIVVSCTLVPKKRSRAARRRRSRRARLTGSSGGPDRKAADVAEC